MIGETWNIKSLAPSKSGATMPVAPTISFQSPWTQPNMPPPAEAPVGAATDCGAERESKTTETLCHDPPLAQFSSTCRCSPVSAHCVKFELNFADLPRRHCTVDAACLDGITIHARTAWPRSGSANVHGGIDDMTLTPDITRRIERTHGRVALQMGLVRRSRHRGADRRHHRARQSAGRHRRVRVSRRLHDADRRRLRDRPFLRRQELGQASSVAAQRPALCDRAASSPSPTRCSPRRS